MQSQPLPFELIPTASLFHRIGITTTEPTTTTPSPPSQPVKQNELSEKSGLAILAHILQRRGSIEFNPSSVSSAKKSNRKPHKESAYIGLTPKQDAERERASLALPPPKELLDRVVSAVNKGVCKQNIRHITCRFLAANEEWLGHLIDDCHVSLVELFECGVLRPGLDDLISLRFVLKDLTRDRTLFSTAILRETYGVNYEQLRQHRRFRFNIRAMDDADFAPLELADLEFNFSHMIEDDEGIDKESLAELNFSLRDLALLGLRPEHLARLDVTERDARHLFRWGTSEYREFVGKK